MISGYSRSLVRTVYRPDTGKWWQAIIDDDSQTLALRRIRRGKTNSVISFTTEKGLWDAMSAIAPMIKWQAGSHDILRVLSKDYDN